MADLASIHFTLLLSIELADQVNAIKYVGRFAESSTWRRQRAAHVTDRGGPVTQLAAAETPHLNNKSARRHWQPTGARQGQPLT